MSVFPSGADSAGELAQQADQLLLLAFREAAHEGGHPLIMGGQDLLHEGQSRFGEADVLLPAVLCIGLLGDEAVPLHPGEHHADGGAGHAGEARQLGRRQILLPLVEDNEHRKFSAGNAVPPERAVQNGALDLLARAEHAQHGQHFCGMDERIGFRVALQFFSGRDDDFCHRSSLIDLPLFISCLTISIRELPRSCQ